MSPLFGGSTCMYMYTDVRMMVVSPGSCYSPHAVHWSPNTCELVRPAHFHQQASMSCWISYTYQYLPMYVCRPNRVNIHSQCDNNCCYSYKDNVQDVVCINLSYNNS